jgi:fucose permease
MDSRGDASVYVAEALFVLVGLGAGVSGVLLPAQILDYGVAPAVIGISFLTGSAGFALGSLGAGAALHRAGTRATLLGAGAMYVAAALYLATRPPFAGFVLVALFTGYATGTLESVLNAYLAARPRSTARLNRLHAFFGVGALLGPLLAAWMLTFTTWPLVSLALAATCVPLTLAVAVTYPRRGADPLTTAAPADGTRPALLPAVLRQPAVLLGTVMLAVYVGLEIGVGNWAYNFLVTTRSTPGITAGYAVSGYWLGLTLGRFLISPAANRLGLTRVGLMYGCLVAVAATAALTWLVPSTGAAAVGFVLLGFFLGPVFPTTMALAPQLAEARLVPTAIGVMNAGSIVGGGMLPWLAGVAAQGVGAWTLLPFALGLALLQLAVWRRIAVRIAAEPVPV